MMTEDETHRLVMTALHTPSILRDCAQQSRALIEEINALPWWRPRRADLWNQYVFLRRLHQLYHEYESAGRCPRPGTITWM